MAIKTYRMASRTVSLFLLIMLFSATAQAKIITVDDDGPADFNNIQAAIDDSDHGDIIEVQPGTYTGDGNRDIDFKGKYITLRSLEGPHNCIIDCQFDGRAFDLKSTPLFPTGLSQLTIQGFNIKRGSASSGGAVHCEDMRPVFIDCIFEENRAFVGSGGALCSEGQMPVLVRCIFIGNLAKYGGAISNSGGDVDFMLITNCVFKGNLAFSKGGAIFARDGMSLTNCTIVNNSAFSGDVGGILSEELVKAKNCILWDNRDSTRNGNTMEQAQITGRRVYTYHCCVEGWSGSFSGYGNIGSDPCLFSDEYHLKPESSCIGEGRNAFVDIDVDIDGQPRVIAELVDIGADEFTIQTPSIEVSSNNFTFQMDEGDPGPSPQSFDIWNGFLDTLNWSIESDCHWLTASPLSGQSEGERNKVTFAIDVSKLHSGRHYCELVVSDANALNSPQRIRVILEVKGPMIGISPETLSFSYYAGLPHPEPKVLSVWNDYIGTLNWSVSEDCNWLSVSPVSGRSDREINEIIVEVDAYGLTVGTYNCVLEVSDSNALNSPVEVPVTLEVRRPVIAVSPEEISFVHAYGEPNPLPQMISIRNADLGILNWQIIEDCNWIGVNPATGRSQGDANMVNITVDASDLSPGNYSCSLAISDPDAANSPYVVPVSLVVGRRTVHVPEHFSTIQDAIDNVLDDGTVILAPDTYTGPGNRDIDFLGKAVTVRSMDPNDPDVVGATIIDCNGTKSDLHRGFYFHSNEDKNSILNGLTIINGYEYYGAAILCEDAAPTIKNCIVMNNVAYYVGGSGTIHCVDGSDSTITSCSVVANEGYGIYCDDSDAVITDCIIEKNKGVGISCGSSYLVITDCIIRNNSTGIGLGGSGANIEYCKIIENSKSGIVCRTSYAVINYCYILRNIGQEGGGVYLRLDSGTTISNCIIAGNLATEEGGGIYCYDESRPKIVNCVIMNNEALGYGGGIYNYDETEPIITNSILWGNKATVGSEIALYSNSGRDAFGKMTISFCDVQGGQKKVFVDIDCVLNWGMGMMDVEPGFAVEGDYHLSGDSPCIDTGTNNPFGGLPVLDIDGNLRPLDGDENGEIIADVGVYEFNSQQPSIALSADSLEFFTQEDGPDPNGQTLLIRNAGGNTLVWEIIEDCDWLEVIPHTGVSDGEINEVMINVVYAGLTHGIYNCKLRIKDEQAVHGPREVMITLYVNKILYIPSEYGTIQSAIDDSIDADVVLVADNTYVGEGNKDLDFKGKNIIVRSENGPDNCIIDCEGQGRGFFLNSWETSPAAIEGFTILNGCPDTVGGGIRCTSYSYNSPVTIKNCVIMNCTSMAFGSYGNGIFCGYGTSIESCTLQGNKGGIAAFYGATIRNCVISENYDSPGIFCQGGIPTIEFCTITNNQGGGISLGRNNAKIESCIITGNVVRQEHSYFSLGAGISCSMGSSPTISNTIISGNFTEIGGGGICCNMESNAKIINCTITGNRASHCGGGIWSFDYCYPLVTNSILWSNVASFGSQIAIGRPTYPESGYGGISVNYCDVEGGATDIFAGSNYTIDWGSGDIDADPCFVQSGYWEVILPPLPAKASEPYPFDGQVSVSIYTDLYWIAGSGATSHDIYFGTSNPPPFVVNQCSTTFSLVTMDYNTTYYWCIDELNAAGKTIGDVWSFTTCEEIAPPPPPPPPPPFSAYTDDVPQYIWIEGDYHLQFDSLCIDTGDPNYITEPNETDLDGMRRVINGRIDMGAYEYNPPVSAEVDIDPNTLNLNSQGRWVTAFIRLPEEYDVADIDPNSVVLDGQVKPERFWLTEDNQIAVTKFDREQVQAILAIGDIELTITGRLADSTSFEASDIIKVIDKGGKK